MKPFSKGDWIAVLIGMVILEVIFLWEIDISVSAMVLSATLDIPMESTNGFIGLNPLITYHIGLWASLVNLFLVSMIGVYNVLKEE